MPDCDSFYSQEISIVGVWNVLIQAHSNLKQNSELNYFFLFLGHPFYKALGKLRNVCKATKKLFQLVNYI